MKTQKSIKTKKHQKTGAGLGQKQRQKKQGQRRYSVFGKFEIRRSSLFYYIYHDIQQKTYKQAVKNNDLYKCFDLEYLIIDHKDGIKYKVVLHEPAPDIHISIDEYKTEIMIYIVNSVLGEICVAKTKGRDIADLSHMTILNSDTINQILDSIIEFEDEVGDMLSK
jgi:hypothetical protein